MLLPAIGILLTLQLCAQRSTLPQVSVIERRAAALSFAAAQKSVASNNFRVHYYELNWLVNPAVYYITGKVTAHFTITQPANTITFDLSHVITVDSVLLGRQRIGFNQGTDETLLLTLPSPLNTGDTGAVTIYYQGRPPANNAAFVQSNHNGTPVIWTLSEPYGAKDWWPCRNGLDDKADSIDVYITHPAQYKATSNGLLQSETTVNSNTTAFYKHRYPIASYLVAFAVTNYSVFTRQLQLGNVTLPVISYVYPENLDDFSAQTHYVTDALSYYYNAFGDYPFMREKYGQTQFGWGGGMEHQTNSFVVSTNAGLMAHELAHQWFGDMVTCGSWRDIWLNEGFADYLADFFFTEKYDTIYHRAFINGEHDKVVSLPNGSVWVDDTTNVDRIFNQRLTYYKGGFLVRMLRWTLGDSAFFAGARSYLHDPKLQYSFAKTADLKHHLEEAGHTNLDYFFNQWFYGQGYPTFKVSWRQNLNNYARVSISQTTSDASVSFFRVPLALTFINSTQSKTVVINDSIQNMEAVFDIGFAADTVLVDPDKQILSKNNTTVKLPALSATANDVTVYPNPFTNKLFIGIKNPVQRQWQLQLFNTIGQRLLLQSFNTTGADAMQPVQLPLQVPAGVYILALDGGDIHVVKKIVRQ